MKVVFETERLILREFIMDDAIEFYSLNQDTEVIKYTGDKPFESLSKAQEFIRAYNHYQIYGYGRWAVILKQKMTFIGWCGLKHNEESIIDIGFRFFRNQWNYGYATEAAKACINFGFTELNLDQIVGRVHSENKASIRVLEKLNMQFWKYGNFEGVENAKYYQIFNK